MTKCAALVAALVTTLALAAPLRAAAGDDYSDIKDTLELCFSCHGPNGKAPVDATIPIIGGQHMYYLYTELKDFAAGRRQDERMTPVVAGLDKTLLKRFAQYFSEQKWPEIHTGTDAATLKKAKEVADSAECFQCHLGGYEGTSGVPRLAGQHEAYLRKTILDLKSGRRGNSAAMSSLMRTFSDEDLITMVKYLSSL